MKIVRPRQVKITSLSVVKIFSTEKNKTNKKPTNCRIFGSNKSKVFSTAVCNIIQQEIVLFIGTVWI